MKDIIKNANIVWIASYPRSGNTFLRTILWQCFGLHSGSIYKNDLGDNKKLLEYVGHIDPGDQAQFAENFIPLMKTHKYPDDEEPAIYVIRDGREVSVSLWHFMNRSLPLEAVIEGQHPFGRWSDHIRSWDPWARPNTLLLRYEDMKNNLPVVLNSISDFLDCDILKTSIPDRNTIAGEGGRWVRRKRDWKTDLSGDLLERFSKGNRDILIKGGYLD